MHVNLFSPLPQLNLSFQAQELITDILSGHKTYSFEDLSLSIKTLLSAHKDLPFAAFTATKLFEYITLKLQYNLTVSTPNPLVLDTLLHDISPLLRLFFALEGFIKSHNPLENKALVEVKCTQNLFRHFLGYVGSKETQDHLLVDLLRVIINPPPGFTSTLSEAQLVSVIEEEISEFKPSIYLALSRIFQFLDNKTVVRLCNDPMELIKGILDSLEDIESPIFHEITRFLYSVHLNSLVQKALIRSEIHMILYKLLQLPYQDFRSQGDIPETFHKTRLLCIQIIVDCVSVQSEAFIAEFSINLLRSDAKYLANSKRQLFIDQVMKPLLKIAPLSDLIPVSLHYQPPLMNQELFKSLPKEIQEDETSCPSSLTHHQYEQLLKHIYAVHTNDEQDRGNALEKSKLNSAQAQFQWKWRTVNGSLKNILQPEGCIFVFPCTFEGEGVSIKIGFYLASIQVNKTGKNHLNSLQNCMFYIAEDQLQFLRSQLYIVFGMNDGDLMLEAHLENPSDSNQFSMIFKYAPNLQSYWIIPPNMCRADLSDRKDLWTKLTAETYKQFKPGPLEACYGYPFYDINSLQPSYSVNLTTELIENSTSSHIVYLVPKNLSLQTFAQVLFQDSPDAIKFLQIESNNKVLKPITKIDESLRVLTISSSFMEAEVLKHMSASPCQVLQRILNQHSDQVQKPLLRFLGVSVENTLQLFEELGRTIKLQNPKLLRKFAALCHQFGSFMDTLQILLGDSLISLLLDFLLEENTSTESIRVFSMTILSHLKFTNIFSVTSNQLFQILNSILISFISDSNKNEFEYLKQLRDILNSAMSQIFFLSDPRVFQSFMNAILWRTAKDMNRLNSVVSFDNNILANVLTNDARTIEEEKEIWGEVLFINPKGIDIERLRAYQILERWTLIFEKLPDQTKSQKLAFEVLKILKVCVYESLIKFRFQFQSKNLFNKLQKLCDEKFVDNPYRFFKEASDNISMLDWTRSVFQEYLNLKFETFSYPLFLEVMTLPLIGFKFLKSLLAKDVKETLETHKASILAYVQFLQKLGSQEYFREKFFRFDINEFYEQWTAAIISLKVHKISMKLLSALKNQLNSDSVKDQLFLEVLGISIIFPNFPQLF